MLTTEEQTNDSNAYFDWLEKAISEDYIKYYDYDKLKKSAVALLEMFLVQFGKILILLWF